MLYNPFRGMAKREWILLSISLVTVTSANITSAVIGGDVSIVKLSATVIGVTGLIFVARGDPWGQLMCVVFSILYAIASYEFRYYGEIITYLCMTMPIAAVSTISWLRHPFEEGKSTVEIHKLTLRQTVRMWALCAAVTVVLGIVLALLHTPNLFFSIISVSTSFAASYLLLFRNSYYALAYALNDIILIILWILATLDDFVYFPIIFCFVIFLVNDLYGFISWKIREKQQRRIRAGVSDTADPIET